MAKKPKAIELVFKAQPAMALLYEIMKEQKKDDKFVKDIESWLTSARELLDRKGNRI
jgi:transposase-like protein